jgi:predicted ATP-dependent protease
MLKDDVIEAVKDGKFHIWSVENVGEGIEILTGTKAGRKLKKDLFEKGSINDLVDKKLRLLSETWISYAEGRSKKRTAKKKTEHNRSL